MTKETKIGLLVGLAFIILFAIILSEKGAGPRPQGAPQFTQVDNSRGGADRTGSTLVDAGKLPLPIDPVASEGHSSRTKPSKPSVAIGPVARHEAAPDELSLPTLEPSLIGEKPASTAAVTVEKPVIVGETSKTTELATAHEGKRSVDSALENALNRTSLTARTESSASLDTPTKFVDTTSTPKVETATTESTAKGRTYVVQPGDTLLMIARRNYGIGTPSAIDAIVKANSKMIKNAHSIRVGQKLTIPQTDRLALVDESAKATPTPTPTPEDRIFIESVDANNHVIDTEKPETRVADSAKSKSESRTTMSGGESKAPKTDAVARASGDKSRELKTDKAKPENASARVYEVKPKDTLQRIARRELGDAKRYKEIEDLNRQVLGRKSRLKPGMKLRLPGKDSASSTLSGESEASARRNAPVEMAAR